MNIIIIFVSIAFFWSSVIKIKNGAKISLTNVSKGFKIIFAVVMLSIIYEWLVMYPEVGLGYMIQESLFCLSFGLYLLTDTR